MQRTAKEPTQPQDLIHTTRQLQPEDLAFLQRQQLLRAHPAVERGEPGIPHEEILRELGLEPVQ